MKQVFLLTGAGNFPEAEQAANWLYPAYDVVKVGSVEELEEQLFVCPQAVVVFSVSEARLGPLVSQLRMVLPSVAFVAVVDAPQKVEDTDLLRADACFLPRPFNTFMLHAQVTTAIRQSGLLSNLEESGQHDEITELYSRNYFMKRLSEEISLSKRHLSPLACVVVGINGYRLYQDSYGNEFINAMLRQIGGQISGHLRHEDIVARIADDEIGILLPRSTEKGARTSTSRLVASLNALTIQHDGQDEEVSVSAGVAGFPLPDDSAADADTLVRYARHALHNARCSDNDDLQLFSEIQPVL